MANTIPTHVLTNSDCKIVRYKIDCYILHTVLLKIIFITATIRIIMQNIEVCIKNCMCYYFNDIIKFEYFDFDILIDEKLYENILNYNISYKT